MQSSLLVTHPAALDEDGLHRSTVADGLGGCNCGCAHQQQNAEPLRDTAQHPISRSYPRLGGMPNGSG